MSIEAIRQAAEIVGGGAKLAAILGVHPTMVSQMVCGRKKVPLGQVRAIEEATGGKVTRAQLRPDIYGE